MDNQRTIIISGGNPFVKKLTLLLKQKKARTESGLFILEGARAVREIPPEWHVAHIVMAESFAGRDDAATLANRADVTVLSDSLFNKISDTQHPQGVMAVCAQKSATLKACLPASDLIIFADKLADPGNLGVMIRTAAAAGCGGVVLSNGCADVYNPKTLRACAGTFFRIPVIDGVDTADGLKAIGEMGFCRVATHPRDGVAPYHLDFKRKCCILIGNEADGISADALALCDATVNIPMAAGVESLNATIAGSMILYEAVRQRRRPV